MRGELFARGVAAGLLGAAMFLASQGHWGYAAVVQVIGIRMMIDATVKREARS